MYRTDELLDLSKTIASELFENADYPWNVLGSIKSFIIQLGEKLPKELFEKKDGNIWIAKDTVIYPSAYISGPCIIDSGAEVRQCAFIHGSVIVGKNCVVGNSAELKNSVLFDGVQVPHFNYVGDSILGYKAHMGAGAVTSNVKGDKSLVVVKNGDETAETGLKKFGAILGDYAEIGCNSVLNPGSIIGRNTSVYPLSSVRGVIPAGCIYKSAENIVRRN